MDWSTIATKDICHGLPPAIKTQGGNSNGKNKCFHSFSALKNFLGSPGQGMAWHHIVEQSQIGKRANFAPERIHNTHNIVSIPSGRNSIHAKISSYYSSKQSFTNGMIVRDWLATKDFEFQFLFGKMTLEQYGELIDTNTRYEFRSN